jgi:uncharacterized DUF497 family protein
MQIEFDLDQSAANQAARGLAFGLVAEFEFETALLHIDIRKQYGEIRIQALGLLMHRVHVVVFKETAIGIRVISLRKANKREVHRYEQET